MGVNLSIRDTFPTLSSYKKNTKVDVWLLEVTVLISSHGIGNQALPWGT